jgi:L-asparaginase/Glu-tRNA(Gln) amidotransferase subunit D
MLLTANHLSQLGIPEKVVVLTGAMTPYRYSATEAMCNFGMAVAAARLLERSGVYIAMHGMVEPWQTVRKVNGVFSAEKPLSAEAG